MAKQIKQIRFFTERSDETRNYPSGITKAKLTDENYLHSCGVGRILQLSIHTLPGTRLYFNGDKDRAVYVGHSGVYQLDLNDVSAILWGVSFDSNDLAELETANAGLIIDVLYEEEIDEATGCVDEVETETIITSTGGKASVTVNSRVKNIHKNIWFAVDETKAPYIMGDTAEREYRQEFDEAFGEMREMYESHVAPYLNPDGTIKRGYEELYAQYTHCYQKKLDELIKKYRQHLPILSEDVDLCECNSCVILNVSDGGDATTNHDLSQSFGTNINSGISQNRLNNFAKDVENAFANIKIEPDVDQGILTIYNNSVPNLDFNDDGRVGG